MATTKTQRHKRHRGWRSNGSLTRLPRVLFVSVFLWLLNIQHYPGTAVLGSQLPGQTSDDSLTGRADEIQAERMRKAAAPRPEPTTGEQYFIRMGRLIRRAPVGIAVGGLGPGAGLTVGSALERHWS